MKSVLVFASALKIRFNWIAPSEVRQSLSREKERERERKRKIASKDEKTAPLQNVNITVNFFFFESKFFLSVDKEHWRESERESEKVFEKVSERERGRMEKIAVRINGACIPLLVFMDVSLILLFSFLLSFCSNLLITSYPSLSISLFCLFNQAWALNWRPTLTRSVALTARPRQPFSI